MERMLIAVDDSVESFAAARYGAQLAAGWNAGICLLTTITDETHRGEAERLLDRVARDVRAAGMPSGKIERVIQTGEAFERILEQARTWHAQLIVMAVSHHTGLRSPYVGSQTEHVLEFATCPVLIVPAQA